MRIPIVAVAVAVVVVVVVACSSSPPSTSMRRPPPLTPDVPVEPAFDPPQPTLRLPRHFTPKRYTARLAIDPALAEFTGEIVIEGELSQRSAAIWLHGKNLDIIEANAQRGGRKLPVEVRQHDEKLELRPSQPLEAGPWLVQITYRGKIDREGFAGAFMQKLGADPYVVTQFESTAARLVFPCIDEPDRKTPWQLTLDVPKGLVAVSNTPVTGTVQIDPKHDRIAFALTRPLPSYLVAFAVGPFEIVDAGKAKSGVPLRVVTPRGTAKQTEALVSSLPRIVDILEAWFAIPFPYPKLDIVIAPSLRGGAMENAGMITDDARGILFDHASEHQRYQVVSTIGHETAHQWFGDLVTAAWWDDIWLNESFATWIQAKILVGFDAAYPDESLLHREVAFLSETLNARKIRQPITSEDDIHEAFDGITYPKGSTVLRMLEHEIGEAKFRDAIHGYLLAHADGNATAADVFAALGKAAGKDLTALTASYFDQAGVPDVTMSLTCVAGTAKVALTQQRFTPTGSAPPQAQTWTIPLCIAFDGGKHDRVERCITFDTPAAEIALDRCPAWFAPATNFGYYRARLDTKALEAIRDRAWALLEPAERVSIFNDLWVSVRAGRSPVALAMSVMAKLRTGQTIGEIAAGWGDITGLAVAPPYTGLPFQLADLIPAELRPQVQARVRATVDPLAKKLGIVATAHEDFKAETLRAYVLGAASWSRSRSIDAEAKRLAVHYRDVPVFVRPLVLQLAVDADPAFAAKLQTEALDEHDPEQRQMMLDAVGGVSDPKRHRAMLESILADPRLTAENTIAVLLAGGVASADDSRAYVRDHLDALIKRLPSSANEDFPLVVNLSLVLRGCDASERDALAELISKRIGVLPSGGRAAANAIEVMDACIARKKAIEPSLRAWLGVK